MRHARTVLAAVAAALLLPALAVVAPASAGTTAIAVGTADSSAAEFALAPSGYAQYPQAFPDGPTFTIGTSDPRQHWPYIHPGPADGWAGSTPHTFTLNVSLTAEEVRASYLVLRHLDTQESLQTTIEVKANGTSVGSYQLLRGAGGGATGNGNYRPSTVRAFIPGDKLQAGTNTLTVTHTAGSWSVYDQVELVPTTGEPVGVQIEGVTPTVLFVDRDGAERQLVDLSLVNEGAAARTTFTATVGAESVQTAVTVPSGVSTQRVAVPPAPKSGPVPLTVVADPGNAEATVSLPYQRRWEFHIDHGSHLDIGYTGLQSDVQRLQNDVMDQAVEGCENTKGYPDAAKFRWGVESMWVLDNYVKERPKSQLDRLAACIRSGQVEITASYNNNLHDLQTSEQMARVVYAGAKKYEQMFDTDVVTGFENDSPAVSWQYVQTLHKAGVKYLVVGHNTTRAPHSPQSTKPGLFWWEAPNGDRVLTWYTSPDTNYTEGYSLFPGGDAETNFDASVSNVDNRLRTLQSGGYDKDLYLSMFRLDNLPAQVGLSDFAKRFGETYTWPKVVVSTPKRFFAEVEKRGTADLPVNRGDWSDWWVDGAGSSARETALTRDAQDRVANAETLGALSTLTTPSDGRRQTSLDEAYRQADLYTEHTWGAAGPTWDDPQWPVKAAFAEKADSLSRTALTSALTDLGGSVDNRSPWPAVAVFNSQSWQRDGVVTATVPEGALGGRPFRLVAGDREVPYQLVSRKAGVISLRFVARGVPSVGYTTLRLVPDEVGDRLPAAGYDPELRADQTGVENQFYKVRLDPVTGAIASIVDKRTGKELVDTASAFKANQFVYRPNAAGANKWADKPTSAARQWTPKDATVRVVSEGPVEATIEVTHPTAPGGAVTGVKALTERITLAAGIPRIDLANTVDKTRVETAEEAYYAFPFKVDDPDVTYEIPGAPVRFFHDQIPGAAMDWQAIGRYADVSSAAGGVLFSAPSAPMVEFGHLRTQEWVSRPGRLDGGPFTPDPEKFRPRSGSIFSYTHNNLWGTNYRIAQQGPVTFRYAIGSHAGGFDAVRATRFGGDVHSDLQAAAVPGRQRGDRVRPSEALVRTSRDGVVVQTVKRADAGQPGLTVRLLEVAGTGGDTTVTLPFPVGAAQLADATERTTRDLPVSGRTVTVPVEKHGIATVLVQPEISITATATDTAVARGESTKVTIGVLNESRKAISGDVTLTGPAGVTITPARSTFDDLAPGRTHQAAFTVKLPVGAALGDIELVASARLGQGSVVPTKVGLTVVDPVEVIVTPSEPDLVEGVPQPIEVTATNNLARAAKLTAHLTVPAGWTVSGNDAPLALEPGLTKTVRMTVTPPAGAFGRTRLSVTVGGDAPDVTVQVPVAVSRPVAVVGTPDRSTAEFALSPAGYDSYVTTFPNGTDLTHGTDAPKTAWSYIQPGPEDNWAQNRDHPAVFRFTLPTKPTEDLTFTAWLLDTNQFHPPVVRVGLNGGEGEARTLPGGGGDGFHWGDGKPSQYGGIRPFTLDVTLPAAQLKAGENVVRITRPAGSWLVYDAFGVRRLP